MKMQLLSLSMLIGASQAHAEAVLSGRQIDTLAQIAAAEKDADLANASVGMAQAWNNHDRDACTDALAEAVAKLAVIYAKDCQTSILPAGGCHVPKHPHAVQL